MSKRRSKITDSKAEREASEATVTEALQGRPKGSNELREELGMDKDRLSRTLQRLRRRDALQVINGRWALTTINPCPTCQGKGWVRKEQ